jgi:serine phosphatase RsbU (regulator of sigma subunit)
VSAATAYDTVCWRLRRGERLLLFTDGLVEARRPDGVAFGRRRLRAELPRLARRPLAEMVRRLVARVNAHQEATRFEDDFTVVAVERVE